MGELIGRADDGDLLASFLWVREGEIALEIHKYLEELRDRTQRELEHAEKRSEIDDYSSMPLDDYYADIASDTARSMRAHLKDALLYCEHSERIWRKMGEDFGRSKDIRKRYTPGVESAPSPLEKLMKFFDAHMDAHARVDGTLADDRNRTHALALQESQMQAFRHSDEAFTLDEFRTMYHTDFELTIAALVKRDGYTIVQSRGGAGDLGADVIAIDPHGTRIVVQCKHTRGRRTIGSPDLQRLNGTARQVHQADVVIAVTNGTYSAPARWFARSQNITLIDRSTLEDWATWGLPLPDVLKRTY